MDCNRKIVNIRTTENPFLSFDIIEFVGWWRTLLRKAEDKVASEYGTIGRANNRRDRIFSEIGWQSGRAADSAASSAAPLGGYPFFLPRVHLRPPASIFKGDPKIANWLIMTSASYRRVPPHPPYSLFLPCPLFLSRISHSDRPIYSRKKKVLPLYVDSGTKTCWAYWIFCFANKNIVDKPTISVGFTKRIVMAKQKFN